MAHVFSKRALLAAAAVSALCGVPAYALQIDNFADSPSQVVASQTTGTLVSTSTVSNTGAAGGMRTLTASGGTGVLGTYGVSGGGSLQFANSSVSAGSLLLTYENFPAPLPPASGIDLTDSGASDGFVFSIAFADALIDYQITIADTTLASSTASGTLPTGILNPGDEIDFYIPFASFIGLADFASVGEINILFAPSNGINGADLTLTEIGTGVVPEPTSLALLTLGGLAMMRRRRA